VKGASIAPIPEVTEEAVEERMVDWFLQLIFFQVPFCDVGHVLCFVDENVIPGLILGRETFRHLLVPLIGALKGCVNVHDDSPVSKKQVMDKLTNRKPAGISYDVLLVRILAGEDLINQAAIIRCVVFLEPMCGNGAAHLE